MRRITNPSQLYPSQLCGLKILSSDAKDYKSFAAVKDYKSFVTLLPASVLFPIAAIVKDLDLFAMPDQSTFFRLLFVRLSF